MTSNAIPFAFPNNVATFLLYRLNLTAISAGTYTIGLDPGSVAAPTGLENSVFSADLLASTNVPFTSVSGTITVDAAAAAVPEPSSIAALVLAGAGYGLRHWRKRTIRSTAT